MKRLFWILLLLAIPPPLSSMQTYTLTWISQPTTTATGVQVTPLIRLRVSPLPPLDAPGIPVTLSVTSGTCTFAGTMAQTSEPATSNNPGVATFDLVGGTLGTNCMLTASAPGASASTSTPFSIVNPLPPLPPLTRFPVPRKP